MISNLISFFISQQLQHEPIYEALALQEGVYLPTGESRDELEGVRVSEVMLGDVEALPLDADLPRAKSTFEAHACHSWPVGDRNRVAAMISSHEIESAAQGTTTLKDVVGNGRDYPFIHADHPVSYALERMGGNGVDVIPVVSRANIHEMFGIVRLSDILAKYGVDGVPGFGAR